MPKLAFRLFALLLSVALVAPAFAQKKEAAKKRTAFDKVEDVAGLPRVLLIGDSISIGYTMQVQDNLKGIANVHRPGTNCASTRQGVQSIDKWLGDGKWDVIHFNWGLHDLKYVLGDSQTITAVDTPDAHPQVSVDEYKANLEKLVSRMEKTGAKLVWRNTTPVPVEGSNGRIPGDAAKYNEAALEVLKSHPDVVVEDMWSFVKPNQDKWKTSKGNVHFNGTANKELGKHVSDTIQAALPKK
ncbi:SGNH/GDSL hydrolase family protein [Blastopirellula sp. JC732]|uniref:SGNH/GDSL hydrolase family protein n=1 Tax=Blastopirellula sediminis TaxID=2894196 RepID=A0A9X1MR30_9BACT|nr:SGNH/GDSL hydrolase family protein [Blastopirellula sediminis]MCC9605813.1 SGNH/GDSL hydrolase family protein [Blastopirellula sediminis]MCC9630887.1 SGNH/GDSL hydrolase family protein [Blastopirellula sediminis]